MSVLFTVKYAAALALISLLYIGCSSSSSSTRYGEHSDESNQTDQSERFSSEDDYMSDDLPEDDEVNLSEVLKDFDYDRESGIDKNEYDTPKEKMLMEIIRYLNTPYKYGGNTKKGIDCSAFTQQVYKNTLSLDLNRSASEQYQQGKEITRIEDLQFGDLVFFDTGRNVKPGHVGIYIGDNLFAHASSKKGVTISSLNHSYYHSRFMGGRRVEPNGIF